MSGYNFKSIEKKWQDKWETDPYFKSKDDVTLPKYYCLDMFPYPSGSGLHVGHWKGYVFSDVYSRKKFLEGFNVLHPMGWDAFGLPAENDAIKKQTHPKINTLKNVENFKVQLKKIGAIYDWSKEVDTTDPDYYKWTQWIFLQMFNKGLAYQETVPVNWCTQCLTGLANEEATGGVCERCGNSVEQKPLRQWVLKITQYADQLNDDLDDLDWPEKVKTMQKNWIGRSSGTQVKFDCNGIDLQVFTTRVDTLFGCSFMVMAFDHELVEKIVAPEKTREVEQYVEKVKNMTDMERTTSKEKTGVFTGSYAINPVSGKKVPVYISSYVLKNYGTGIVMAVPAHDERDFEFAQKFGLEIIQVVEPKEGLKEQVYDANKNLKQAFVASGKLINSEQFNGLESDEAKKKITEFLQQQNKGEAKTCYKLRDWVFSRQRYWGEPIPLIHCGSCGVVGVPEKDLPVLLPRVDKYQPTGTGESPLSAIGSWVNVDCPKCFSPAKRETNTMPQWAGSCWYFLRYVDPENPNSLAAKDLLKYWMPVDFYVGGIEHAVLHLLYARFYVKFLHEIGAVPFKEPFKKLFNQGMVCAKADSGRVEKMSKSKGNVVNPDDIVEKYGSDTLRMYMLFMGPPEMDTVWQDESIKGVYNFLNRLWTFLTDDKNILSQGEKDSSESKKRFHIFLDQFEQRIAEYKVNTAVSAMMEYLNDLSAKKLKLSPELCQKFLTAISVMVPHFSSELLEKLFDVSLKNMVWPKVDKNLAIIDDLKIPVQINGKLKFVIEVSKSQSKEEVLDLAKKQASKWIEEKTIVKTIFVPERLINFVIK